MNYWVEGASQLFQTPLIVACSLFVYKGEVFSSGNIVAGTTAGVWKNRQRILTYTGIIDEASSSTIYVYNDDIYVTGINENAYACYWKNSERITLSNSASSALAVLVKPKLP